MKLINLSENNELSEQDYVFPSGYPDLDATYILINSEDDENSQFLVNLKTLFAYNLKTLESTSVYKISKEEAKVEKIDNHTLKIHFNNFPGVESYFNDEYQTFEFKNMYLIEFKSRFFSIKYDYDSSAR